MSCQLPSFLTDIKSHKKVFYGANVAFWVLGWASFGIGIWLYLEKSSYSLLAPSSYTAMSAAGLSVFTGLLVIIIAIVGCLGVWKSLRMLLLVYICALCLLLLVQSMAGVMGILEESAQGRVKYALLATINRTHMDNFPINRIAITWDEMQAKLRCCGVDGPKDWFQSVRWPKMKFVPDSCCDTSHFVDDEAMHSCGKNNQNKDRWYQKGCYEPFTDWLLQHTRIILIVALLFLIVDVVLLVTSTRILRHIWTRDKPQHSVQYTSRNEARPEEDCRLLQ